MPIVRAPCTGQTPGEVAGGVPWSEARRSTGVTWPQSHVSRITVSGDARESERGPEPQPGPSPFLPPVDRRARLGGEGRWQEAAPSCKGAPMYCNVYRRGTYGICEEVKR